MDDNWLDAFLAPKMAVAEQPWDYFVDSALDDLAQLDVCPVALLASLEDSEESSLAEKLGPR
jgi:hypothetical protein